MKACKDCMFSERKAMVVGQNPDGSLVQQMAYACANPENGDPVEGTPLPCQVCRTNPDFCGIVGKRWKAKPVEEVTKPPQGKVITLS